MGSRNNPRRKSKKQKNSFGLKLLITIILIIVIFFLLQQILSYNNNDSWIDSYLNEIANISNDTSDNETTENTELEQTEVEEDITFTMAVTGDIMCHDSMYMDAYDSSTESYDFSYIFEDVKYYLQTADITVGNLETTFAGSEYRYYGNSKCKYSGYPTFNTPEELATNLKKAGFDVVSTANNHCMDKGYSGLVSTIKYLDEADLSHTGTFTSEEEQQQILIKNVKNVKIAFLSFTYGTNGITIPSDKSYAVNLIDKDLIKEQLELAKEQEPDLICVSMHWGSEYQTSPNSTQTDLADFLFENGADIILGNHPHVLQRMEKRTIELEDGSTKEGFVVYSLGNFMSAQKKAYTRDSAILNLTITKDAETGKISIDKAEYTPLYMERNGSPKKYKIYDVENEIAAYEAGASDIVSKSTYNTLVTELKNIKKFLGDEIT